MKNDNYKILEIFEFRDLDQLVIPEIQRDYVWGKNEVFDLLESIKDGFESENEDIPYLGFIYVYNDRDYVYKYFLIDGQQRMTTVYLILLACYQLINKKIPDYLFDNGKLKLDYKVRQATHDFLTDFVKHCQNYPNTNTIKFEDQVWFHKDYENDKTIKNIAQNYIAIIEWLNSLGQENISDFLDFVENKVEISSFDIEDGRQSEDLYIYMNSRGRQLEANESLKAKFLARIKNEKEKLFWGKKWENWHDFFWKHRGNNPDADNSFNEFLSRIQIINMCDLGIDSSNISDFAIDSDNKKIIIDSLPKTLYEIERYFESYKWLVESEQVKAFFKKYESEHFLTKTPDTGRQIYYLRILPIISLLSRISLRDEDIVVRFIRFFYNVARKSNVGKDIANQLPIAIRLTLEYSNNLGEHCDVCDLIDYQKGRTVIINDEEVLKLSLYKEPPVDSTRQELEDLFWAAEDHLIFDGEIMFLLNEYHLKDQNIFDLSGYKKTWDIFMELFNKENSNNSQITKALLYYGNTWERVTPFYYNNYNCQNWNWLVRADAGKYLLTLLKDMHGKSADHLDDIIKPKINNFFTKNALDSIEKMKSEKRLFSQVRVLAAIDYYSNKILWERYGHIAEDINYTYGDTPFFDRDRRIFNISRYIRNGAEGRIMSIMKNVLSNEEQLKEILINILECN